MKWLYIGFAALGGITAAAIVVQRTSTYFHNVATALERPDLDFDIMLIYGLGFGLLFVPPGMGVGLLVAFLINLAIEYRAKMSRPRLSDDASGGSSWVTLRHRQSQPKS
jgi:hypothetical protein